MTAQATKLYRDVIVGEVRQSLKKSLKKPLEKKGFSDLKASFLSFANSSYKLLLVKEPSSIPTAYEIEGYEYTSSRVIQMWKKRGESLTSSFLNDSLRRMMTSFTSPKLSRDDKNELKREIVNLSKFVRELLLKRYPNVSLEALNLYESKLIEQAYSQIEDPTSSFKKKLDEKEWALKADNFFKNNTRIAELNPEQDIDDFLELYNKLWKNLLQGGFLDAKADATTTNVTLATEFLQYLQDVRDTSGKARNDFLLQNPFLKQKKTEEEAMNWLLKFGVEISQK